LPAIRPHGAPEESNVARLSGSCLCGGVRYESDAQPLMTAVCHCKDCQKASGSAFSVNLGVPAASLKVAGESLATFEHTGGSGLQVFRRFCRNCGSSIFTDIAAMPGVSFVKGGTLDDTSWVRPQVNIWCASRQPWVPMDPAVAQLPGNPPSG
jgi:hypothetical protein